LHQSNLLVFMSYRHIHKLVKRASKEDIVITL